MSFDKHLEGDKTAGAPSPFTDSVINSRERQGPLNSSQLPGGLPEFHLVDNQILKTEDKPSNPLIQDLVYRTTIDPVQEQCGALLANFDSITGKMSKLFKDPLIKRADGFTGDELSHVVNDKHKMSRFTPIEQKSLTVLDENSERIFGSPAARLVRQNVVDLAEQLGILKHT